MVDFLRHRIPFLAGSTSMPLHLPLHWDAIYGDLDMDFEWGGISPTDVASSLSREAKLPTGPTLVIGAGASRLASALYVEGYKPIVQSDFSTTIVAKRADDEIPYLQADATSREAYERLADALGDEPLNIVDKGLIDGLYISSSTHLIASVVSAGHGALSRNGSFVFYSYTHPSYMTPCLGLGAGMSFDLRVNKCLGDSIYLYHLKKRPEGERRKTPRSKRHQQKSIDSRRKQK